MSGRGTFAIGNNVDYTYESIDKIEGAKVLSGKDGLLEESYSSTAYIKLKPGGTFYEMRIYDENHYLIKEIAYHPEPAINHVDRKHNILHVHDYLERDNFKIRPVHLITKEEHEKYKKFFKGVPQYEKW